MSEVTQDVNVEERKQEKLASLYLDLLWNVGCASVGWLLYMIPITGLLSDNIVIVFATLIIFGAPLLVKWMANRSITGLFKFDADYEVITTYGDGRKESDGGHQSRMMNLALSAFLALVLLFLSAVLQPIRIIIMSLKYTFLYKKCEQKPPFILSGFFVLAIGFVILVGGLAIGKVLQDASFAKLAKERRTSEFTIEEVSPMLAGVQQQLASANSISYYTQSYTSSSSGGVGTFGKKIYVDCNRERVCTIKADSDVDQFLPGTYTINGNQFVGFNDTHSLGKTPSQSDIDSVIAISPTTTFLSIIASAKPEDVVGKARGTDYNELRLFMDTDNQITLNAVNKDGNWVLLVHESVHAIATKKSSLRNFRVN